MNEKERVSYFHDMFYEPLNESLRHTLKYLLSKIEVDRINIYIYHKKKNILQSQIVYFNNKILLGDEEIYLNNSINDKRIRAIQNKKEVIKNYEIIVPLFENNNFYGLITIDRLLSKKKFKKKELEFINDILFFIALSIKNHTNVIERESKLRQLNAILKINNLLRSDMKLEKIFKKILKYLYQYGLFDRVRLYKKEKDYYIKLFSEGMLSNKSSIKNNIKKYTLKELEKKNASGIYYIVPLRNNGGNPYAFIEVDNIISQIKIEKDQINFLKIVATQLSLFLKNYSLIEKLKKLSNTDPLTEAYNYRYFRDALEIELEKAKRFKYSVSLLFIDINNFKEINDKYGHLVGDEVLIKVVQSIKNLIRKSDILCRYGGDEFVIILPHIDKKGATILKNRLIENFVTVKIMNESKKITYSIGISTYPDEAKNIDILLKKADKELYKEKNEFKNIIINEI